MWTSKFKSKPFSFRRGVFQGDPLSPIVFLMVFNPILQSLKQEEERFGYKLEDKMFITLPYADDFCLITTNKRSHQKIINNTNDNVLSMGMKLKPSKCRSFSICSGRPTSFFTGCSFLKLIDGFPISICQNKENYITDILIYLEAMRNLFNKLFLCSKKATNKIWSNFE